MYKVRYLIPALLVAFISFSCSENDSVIDSPLPQLPLSFASLDLSEYGFDTDSISVVPNQSKTPDDPVTVEFELVATPDRSSAATIDEAMCFITPEGKSNELRRMALVNSGGNFTGHVNLDIERGDVGEYRVSVRGTDSRGMETNTVFTKIIVIFGSKAPVFCGLTAPDTVTRPQTGSKIIKLVLCVSDPSGPGDIKRVQFESFRPDGAPSSGNPFEMFDDASHGDDTANDGNYTLEIHLPSNSMPGDYRFQYQAFDRSNLSSNVLIDTLVVN